MGVIYFVGCYDCKKYRDLDKFYAAYKIENRQEALELSDLIEHRHSFRAALLASFMYEHKGHHCTMFTEYDDEDEIFRETAELESDKYWCTDP